jgi:hypothetical protein
VSCEKKISKLMNVGLPRVVGCVVDAGNFAADRGVFPNVGLGLGRRHIIRA